MSRGSVFYKIKLLPIAEKILNPYFLWDFNPENKKSETKFLNGKFPRTATGEFTLCKRELAEFGRAKFSRERGGESAHSRRNFTTSS